MLQQATSIDIAPPSAPDSTAARDREFIALIPARVGSKGLPRKNILDLCGKPLIAYTIEAMKKSRYIDRIVVSTDSDQIAGIAKEFGAEVPFLRPPHLSTDESSLGDVFTHALMELYGGYPGHVVFATPFTTSPFRNPRLVDGLLEKIVQGYQSVISVREIPVSSGTFFRHGDAGIIPLVRPGSLGEGGRRRYFRPYGLFSCSQILPELPPDSPPGPRITKYIHIIDDPYQLVDIDYPDDFRLAEMIIRENLFDFDLR